MQGINLLVVAAYVLLSFFAAAVLPRSKRWTGILTAGLISLYLFSGKTVLVLTTEAFGFYLLGSLIFRKIVSLKIAIPIAISPLLISKFFEAKGHFTLSIGSALQVPTETNLLTLFNIVGISYFTFVGIGYLIDIKRGYIEPEQNYFKLLLFLIYFPAITSGPIHRAKYLIPLFDNIEITDESVSRGLRLILWGLFKNLVIGQRLFTLLTTLYWSEVTGLYTLFIGLLFFLYLYVNFSSYIDIFQGVSELINIRIKNNFKNRIYLANSRQNFWSGWHITLNEWFRDYFTFPLAKVSRQRIHMDVILLVTFILIALWHEMTKVMLVWGTLNGMWIILEKRIPFQQWRYPQFRRKAGTLYHLFLSSCLALVFITPSTNDLIERVFQKKSIFAIDNQITISNSLVLIFSIVIMDSFHRQAKHIRFDEFLSKKSALYRWTVYFILSLFIMGFASSPALENYYLQF